MTSWPATRGAGRSGSVLLAGFLCAFAFMLCADGAAARLDYHLGATARVSYDDNLLLRSSGEEDDLVTDLTPFVGFGYERPRFKLTTDYSLDYVFHRDHPELDKKAFNEVQRLRSTLRAAELEGFALNASDVLERVNVDSRAAGNENNLNVNSANRNTLLVSPSYRLTPARGHEVVLGYDYELVTYHDVSAESLPDERWSHAGTLTYGVEHTARFKSHARAEAMRQHATLTTDYDQYQGALGMDYEAGARSLLQCEAGWGVNDYEDESSENAFLWAAKYSYRAAKRLSLAAATRRTLEQGETDGSYKYDKHDVTGTYEGGNTKVNLSLYYLVKEFFTAEREDRVSGVDLRGSHALTERVRALVSAGYARYDLTGPDVSDKDVYHTSFRFEYERGWLKTGAGYTHRREDSEADGGGYISNIYSIDVTARI